MRSQASGCLGDLSSRSVRSAVGGPDGNWAGGEMRRLGGRRGHEGQMREGYFKQGLEM